MQTANSILSLTLTYLKALWPLAGAYLVIVLRLRQSHADYVHALVLGFAVSFVSVFPLAFLVNYRGWITTGGNFVGNEGHWVEKATEFMLDVPSEMTFVLTLISTLFLIQILTYLVTALMGCASPVSLLSKSIGIGTLFILKSCISGAGFVCAILINNWIYQWKPVTAKQQLEVLDAACTFIMFSFTVLYGYLNFPHDLSNMARKLLPRIPRLRERLISAHRWATRYQKPAADHSTGEDLLEVAVRVKAILGRQLAGQTALRKDMAELLVLVQETERWEATTTVMDKAGRPRQVTEEEQAQMERRRARIVELRTRLQLP